MDNDQLKKLRENLNKRLKEIDLELLKIASENPLVKGDFEVKVEDLGKSLEDTEQEAGELDRNQALVNALEKEGKDIRNTLNKINSGLYGKCENCSSEIAQARLKAVPVAKLCINCAKKNPF